MKNAPLDVESLKKGHLEIELLGEHIATQAAHLDAATHRLLADIRKFDQAGGWFRQGARSCAGWLSWRVGWDSRTARDRVRVASRLGELPLVDEALRRAELSYSKVRAICRVATPEIEATLVEYARHTTGAQLEKICRMYASVVRHDDDTKPADDLARRTLRWRELEDGMVRLEVTLHRDDAAFLKEAIERVAAERCRQSGSVEPPLATSDQRGSAEPVSDRAREPSTSEHSAPRSPVTGGSVVPDTAEPLAPATSGSAERVSDPVRGPNTSGEQGTHNVGMSGGSAEPVSDRAREPSTSDEPAANMVGMPGGSAVPALDARGQSGSAEPVSDRAREPSTSDEPAANMVGMSGGSAVPALDARGQNGSAEPVSDRAREPSTSDELAANMVGMSGGSAVPALDARDQSGSAEPVSDRAREPSTSDELAANMVGMSGGSAVPALDARGQNGSAEPVSDRAREPSTSDELAANMVGMSGGSAEPVSDRAREPSASGDVVPGSPATSGFAPASSRITGGSAEPVPAEDEYDPESDGFGEDELVNGEPLCGNNATSPPTRAFDPSPGLIRARAMREAATQKSFDRAGALVAMAQDVVRGTSRQRSPINLVLTSTLETLLGGSSECQMNAGEPSDADAAIRELVEAGAAGRIASAPNPTRITAMPRRSEVRAGAGVGVLPDGSCISAAATRRLACDCAVTTVVDDEHGNPRSISSRFRKIPGAMKAALLRLDQTCRYPGCNAKAFLEGHHLRHWADGGPTVIPNLLCLCTWHHRFVHEYGFEISMDDERRVTVTDPLGRKFVDVPVRHVGPVIGAPVIQAANANLQITAATPACGWNGEPVDYPACVDGVLAFERHARRLAGGWKDCRVRT